MSLHNRYLTVLPRPADEGTGSHIPTPFQELSDSTQVIQAEQPSAGQTTRQGQSSSLSITSRYQHLTLSDGS